MVIQIRIYLPGLTGDRCAAFIMVGQIMQIPTRLYSFEAFSDIPNIKALFKVTEQEYLTIAVPGTHVVNGHPN